MFSHVTLGTNDFERDFAFYANLMATLGHELRFSEPHRCWAAWQQQGVDGPLFIVGRPHDGGRATHGNGQMVAFETGKRVTVDRCFEAAIASGGSSEGPPGLRPEYHPNYYGAYFRDPGGNKICVCCHLIELAWHAASTRWEARRGG
jgi:catechol 2,3-dioxygenase-like lactoylglutathione lyase family enzyme